MTRQTTKKETIVMVGSRLSGQTTKNDFFKWLLKVIIIYHFEAHNLRIILVSKLTQKDHRTDH